MKTKIVSALVVASAVLASYEAQASFNLSLRTTTLDSGSAVAAAHLFNQGAPSGPGVDASETTDPLWFVIDMDGDGVFAAGALANPAIYNGTLSGLISTLIDSDDYLVQLTVNSGIEGRTLQNVLSIPTTAQTGGTGPADIGGTVRNGYAILFDDANLTDGGSFGFDQVFYRNNDGTTTIPASGNLQARISQDIYADTYEFSVAAVPEPTTAVFAGIGLGALALIRRRASRA